MSSSTFYPELVDKFIGLVMEYIHLANTSEAIKTSEQSMRIIDIGLSTLFYVFSSAISISQSIEVSVTYAERGTYYFMEYIDQLNKTGMMQTLDCTDVVKFVYSKTISELYGGGNTTSVNRLNETSVTNNNVGDLRVLIQLLGAIVDTVLWISNSEITHMQRLELAHMYIQPMIPILISIQQYVSVNNLTHIFNGNDAIQLIRTMQEIVVNMSYVEYSELLETLIQTFKKIERTKKLIKLNDIRLYISAYYRGKNMCQILEFEHCKTISEVVKGWK